MTGWRATLEDSTVCSIERALLDTSIVYLFNFIEGKAVSVINLNYSSCIKSFTCKIVKKCFIEKKTYLKQKTYFLSFFFLRKTFFGKQKFWKKNFSPLAHKSPGAL